MTTAIRTSRGAAAALLVLLVVGLLPSAASAVPGEPQPGFAGDGTLDLPSAKRTIATDDQGRIVAASVPNESGATTLSLQRFTAAGAPDASFAGDGEVALTFAGTGAGVPQLLSVDGGILVGLLTADGFSVWSVDAAGTPVAGYGGGGRAFVPTPDTSASHTNLAGAVPVGDGLGVVWTEGSVSQVTMLGPTGQPRASFGGDGTIDAPALSRPQARSNGGLVALGTGLVAIAADGTVGTPVPLPIGANEFGVEFTVDAQDRILLATSVQDGGTILRRLSSTFALDTSYGTGGAISLPGPQPRFAEVAGRRFVITSLGTRTVATNGYRGRLWVSALDEDAALDPEWGSGGVVAIDEEFALSRFVPEWSSPVATLAAAPAGGVAVGVKHAWKEPSPFGTLSNFGAVRLHQFGADGAPVAAFDSSASHEILDGGDGGATVVARSLATASGYQVVRIELQQPDAPGAPGAPTVTAVDGKSVKLAWTAAAGGPDTYVVSAFEPGSEQAVATAAVPASKLSATLAVPHTGRPYRFDVFASAGTSVGDRSSSTPYTVAPHRSMAGFVDLIASSNPSVWTTPTARAITIDDLGRNGRHAVFLDSAASQQQFRSDVDPVTRIYVAYFGRLPDSGGLRYWVGKRRAGATVARISAQFAASSEFRRTYGNLTDRAFVSLVYENVLGRSADKAGLDYWTARLATKRTSRGQLMANFSESSEYVRKLGPKAWAVRSYYLILGRAPRAAEAQAVVESGAPTSEQLVALLESPEYAARVG